MLLFTGTANVQLSKNIAQKLLTPLQNAQVTRFSDGEIRVELLSHVRGENIYIIQPTCSPTNDNLMELVLMTDALKRADAQKVTAVIPYYGYCRQDRRPGYARVPVSARVVANMLESAGVDHVITMDIHAAQIGGFFSIPFDNIAATHLIAANAWQQWHDLNPMIVSPDVGGVARAREVAKHLHVLDLAIIDKRRQKANESEVMNIIGDVAGRMCIMVDDMVDTAGTLCKAADALTAQGASKVVAYCTHPVLSGKAISNITNSSLHQLVVTDTIPLSAEAAACDKIHQMSVASILAETIHRIETHESVSQILE